MRRPEVTIGGRGSNGTELRLTVMQHLVQEVLGLLAVERRVAQVGEHEVHIRSPGEHVDAAGARVVGGEALGEDLRAADGAGLAVREVLGRPRS